MMSVQSVRAVKLSKGYRYIATDANGNEAVIRKQATRRYAAVHEFQDRNDGTEFFSFTIRPNPTVPPTDFKHMRYIKLHQIGGDV